jgi:HEAT repeat protein
VARKAFCPVAAPERIPRELDLVFSGSSGTYAQMDALSALGGEGPSAEALKADPELARRHQDRVDALRWLLHQANVNDTLRNEIANLLREWRVPTLARDLTRMSQDEAQGERWRAWCLQHLAEQCLERHDPEALEGLEAGLTSKSPTVRRQALFSLARLGGANDWRRTDPARFARLRREIEGDLERDDEGVVVNAVDAAVQLRLTEATRRIEAVAGNERMGPATRICAVNGLGELGDTESQGVLYHCLETGGQRLKEQANVALQKILKRGERR